MSALSLDSGEAHHFRPPVPRRPRRDLPFIGVALALRRNSLAAWPERAYEELMVHRRFLGVDCWLVNDPEGARRVLRDRADDYPRPVATLRMLRPGTGDGLLLAEGDAWKEQRRLIAPHFSPASVERMLPAIQAAASAALAGVPESGHVDLARLFEAAAIDTIGRALFSTPLGHRAARIGGLLRRYFKGAARGTVFDFLAKGIGDHAWALRRRAAWSREWFSEVDALIAERGARNDSPYDLYKVIAGGDAQGLRDQAATMLSTGFESTARTMFWAAYLLSHDETEQEAARAEILKAPPDAIRSLADLKAWPRLTRIIQETMRLYPPVSTLIRRASADDAISGRTIARGAFVIVCPWVMHRHRAHWEQPDDFMPGRFAGRADMTRDGTYLPFGMGKRVCIGATMAQTEAAIVLARLLSRWRIRLDDARPVLPVAVATTVPDREPPFRLTPHDC